MGSEALLPCPMCGTANPAAYSGDATWVECVSEECGLLLQDYRENASLRSVAEMWNRRAGLAPAISNDLRERLRQQCAMYTAAPRDSILSTDCQQLLRDLLAALDPAGDG